jgi:LPPG:FO 2-phospho-L-lactate transferase
MKVAALAGGIGAGKFLRGLVRVVDPSDVTVIVNTGDDIELHGLYVSPDLDSVMYWLAGVMDRERGWGRQGDTFRTLEEVTRLGGHRWFGLGDLDLATHMVRSQKLAEGESLSTATAHLCERFGLATRLLPMSDDPVRTWIDFTGEGGIEGHAPFQVWWVGERGEPEVKAVQLRGADEARPAPGVLEAIAGADAIMVSPSNPVVSTGPILAVPGIADALRARRDRAVGISPIVGGAPLRGMADRLMPVVGLEVTALGAARPLRDLIATWVIDERDRALGPRIEEELGLRVAVTDTIMADDEAAERLARVALDLAAS